jgi:hypothetical protein
MTRSQPRLVVRGCLLLSSSGAAASSTSYSYYLLLCDYASYDDMDGWGLDGDGGGCISPSRPRCVLSSIARRLFFFFGDRRICDKRQQSLI